MTKIAIDGPSGAGKSTISKQIAKRLGFVYIDTGAMYRACALACLRANINPKTNPADASALVDSVQLDLSYGADGTQLIFLNGEDVSGLIRTPEVSIGASDVSAIPAVRIRMVELQQELASRRNVIMDGRDIGTHVLPDANVKIFLTASAEDRAQRRYEELRQRGEQVEYDDVLRDMRYRDQNDSSRAFAPLTAAPDAIVADTTGNTLEQSIAQIYQLITERIGE